MSQVNSFIDMGKKIMNFLTSNIWFKLNEGIFEVR